MTNRAIPTSVAAVLQDIAELGADEIRTLGRAHNELFPTRESWPLRVAAESQGRAAGRLTELWDAEIACVDAFLARERELGISFAAADAEEQLVLDGALEAIKRVAMGAVPAGLLDPELIAHLTEPWMRALCDPAQGETADRARGMAGAPS